jgi:Delta3-Delta2-enoyl-CoA isomerase
VIELDQDGSVFVLRMRSGENRFGPQWLAGVNEALDRVEAYDGVGIPACIATARLAAEQVLAYLDSQDKR